MKYKAFSYIYPPRPSNAIPFSALPDWDTGSMCAQPKMNGSNCLVFTDGNQVHVMNRHAARLTNFRIAKQEILSVYRGTGGWLVLNGEYMNKGKLDENSACFNHKLVIFDILVHDSEYLVGKTFAERIDLLDSLYGLNPSEKQYLFSITPSIYRVKTSYNDFSTLFEYLTSKGSLIEGLVLKRKRARLEIGNTPGNNTKSQIKCRLATKNYRF